MTGATYTCKNQKCSVYGHELTLNPTWPIGAIQAVIDSSRVKAKTDLQEHLTRKRDEGRKYALVQKPNNDEVEILGYRYFVYCPQCHIVWERDLLGAQQPEDISGLVDCHCDKCQAELKTSDELNLEGQVPCPHCQEEMEKRLWFPLADEKKEKNEEAPE